MSDWDNEIVIEITEKGAAATDKAMKEVIRSYDKLKRLSSEAINPLGVRKGQNSFADAFSPKAMQEATGALHHLGIEYEAVKSRMKAPLSGGDDRFLDAFTKIPAKLERIPAPADKASNSLRGLATMVRTFNTLLIATGAERFVRAIFEMGDELTTMGNKIRVVTTTHGEWVRAMHDVAATAREVRVPLEAVSTVYSRTQRSVEGLGKTQGQVLEFTNTLTKAVQVGGSTAVEASQAMIQLSQGLASGSLKGDELRSVLEQLPVVSQLIAKEMGITTGQLRKFGSEGKITSDTVFKAIIAGGKEINEKFAKMTPTISQAFDVLHNKAVESTSALQPFFQGTARGILTLSDNFDTLVRGGKSVAYVLGVLIAEQAVTKLIAAIKALRLAEISTGWGGLIVAAGSLMAALAPFADKLGDVKKNIDGVNESSVTLKDVWTEFSESLGSKFSTLLADGFSTGGIHIKLFIVSLEDAIIRAGKLADAVRLIMDPVGSAARYNKGGKDALREFQHDAENFVSRARGRAADRQAQSFQDKYSDTNTRFNAFLADNMPGAHPKTMVNDTKTKKEGGLTFQELMEKMRQEQEVAGQTPFESGVTKEFFEKMGELKKSIRENLVTHAGRGGDQDHQLQALQIMIRQEHELAEAQKFVVYWDGKIAEEAKRRAEAGIKAGDHERDSQIKARQQIDATNRAIESSFDPLSEYNSKINDLNTYLHTHANMLPQVTKQAEKLGTVYQTFVPVFQQMSDGLADAAANSLVFGNNLSDSLKKIAQASAASMLSGLFKIGIGLAIGTPMPGLNGGNPITPPVKGGARGGYFPGYEYGGYTGSYARGDIAGVVHGQEFVVNANATARNRAMLESMNSGKPVGVASVNIHNYAGAQVEAHANDNGDIEVMIHQAIAQHAPRAVAQDLANRNGKVAKALRQNYEVTKRN